MKSRLALVTTLAVGLFSASNAWAVPLTYTTVGVVGTIDGNDSLGSEANELTAAQALLNMAMGAATPLGCESLAPDGNGDLCYKTNEAHDYDGTLTDFGTKVESPTVAQLTISSEFEYAIAKYDGQNAGYILFYLPAFGYTIPNEPFNFWSAGPGQEWEVSHIIPLNGIPREITEVPDGGATLGLLGLGLMGLGYVRRRTQ